VLKSIQATEYPGQQFLIFSVQIIDKVREVILPIDLNVMVNLMRVLSGLRNLTVFLPLVNQDISECF